MTGGTKGHEVAVTVAPSVGLVYDAFDRGPVYALINYLVRYFREAMPTLRLSAQSQGVTIFYSGDYPADENTLPACAFLLLSSQDRDDWIGSLLLNNDTNYVVGMTQLTTVRAEVWGRTPAERDMLAGRMRRQLKAARRDLRSKGVYNILVRYSSPRGMELEGTTWSRRDQAAQTVRMFRHIIDFLVQSEEGVGPASDYYDFGVIEHITITEQGTGVTQTLDLSHDTFGKDVTITVS